MEAWLRVVAHPICGRDQVVALDWKSINIFAAFDLSLPGDNIAPLQSWSTSDAASKDQHRKRGYDRPSGCGAGQIVVQWD